MTDLMLAEFTTTGVVERPEYIGVVLTGRSRIVPAFVYAKAAGLFGEPFGRRGKTLWTVGLKRSIPLR